MAKLNSNFKGRLQKYFSLKIGAFPYRNGWLKSKCPYCGRDNKFGINLSANRCNCFRCGEHPSPLNLVLYLEQLDTYAEAIKLIESEKYSGYTFKEEEVEIRQKKPMYLPEGVFLLNQGDSVLARGARNYIKERGFDVEELSRKGWGYGTEGKYFGYIIIPFYERGTLSYFNARLFMGNGPRYNNPDVTDSGIGKSQLWFNQDALYMYNSIFICEGAFNAQTMGDRGIASGGKAISRYQINQLIKSPVKRVIILLDPDAKDRAIDVALRLVNYKKVKVVFLPEDKDVNDLGKKEVLRRIYSVHYQDYSELMKIKHSL